MRWWRIALGAAGGFLFASVIWDIYAAPVALAYVQLGAWTIFVAFVAFREGGHSAIRRLLKDADESLLSCVGGPLDGMKIPPPPGPGQAEVRIIEHPEGHYSLIEDQLLWVEDS